MMRILYVSRLFSGLAEGIRDRRWDPRGVPTVYRLLEALDKSEHELRIVFTVKDDAVGWEGTEIQTFPIEGFGREITVIPQRARLPAMFGRARGYLREIDQYRDIRRLRDDFAPDIAYFDRVNIYQAALLARRTTVPVVWRVMGVPPAMHDMLDLGGPVARLTRWAYRAPFAMVTCSRDGSGGEQWMDRALAPDTPRRMMLNGVDIKDTTPLATDFKAQLEGPETKILFVARLVEDKGCIEFVDAVSTALNAAPGRFRAIIAGSGPLAGPMRERAQSAGHADQFHFLGQLPHDEVLSLQRECDIYVSLNRMCNLTNANLEAMRTGVCMIIPASPGIRGIDVDTDELMPPDTIWRISDAGDVQGLSDALIRLDSEPDERKRRARATFEQAEMFIPTWTERIAEEIQMLEQLGTARN
ncbi:MAG: glycosyltransferase family 4 protein [Rhodospirillaceae bacterium]|nr:glycosyltransferase family 4 protein [Rhodospirillaceae bacterium]MBT7362680.1 glycosyltransferase family 4 protein [Rhodospirillaceae bacterium]